MYTLGKPLMDFYALNGQAMNGPVAAAMRELEFSDEYVAKRDRRYADVLAGRRPDRLPISADLRWWIAEQFNDGTLHASLKRVDVAKIMATTWTRKNAVLPPILPDPPQLRVHEEWSGEPVVYANGGFPGSRRTLRIETPKGSLQGTEVCSSRSFGIVEYPVKTAKDLRIARYIYEERSQFGGAALPAGHCPAPLTPLQNLLVHMCGVEAAVFLMLDAPAEVNALMSFLGEIEIPLFEALAARGGMVFSCENLSADVSGSYWDRYLGPQLKARADLCARHGARYGIHHDGKLQPLFQRLREAGITYANGITAAPAGDVEPEGLRALAGPDLIMADIVPQCLFMEGFSDAEFDAYIERVVELFKDDGRAILGIGDMLPATATIERVERYFSIVEQL